jgi:transcriptional antiterminator Rof (Rho-off)
MKEYQPIACQLHDHIEHFATLRKVVDIHYLDDLGKKQFIKSVIKDWINTGYGEFMVLQEKGIKIRFDNILSIDHVDFQSLDNCDI